MMVLIIPNYVADAINAKLDIALAECPEAVGDRDALYHQLLGYFDEHGVIPNFSLQRHQPSS
jgi:hypothetical protein